MSEANESKDSLFVLNPGPPSPLRIGNDVYYVYILRCRDNSFYVGQTANIKRRLVAHNQGLGAKYTHKRRPVKLVYLERSPTRVAAVRRERQLKGWTKRKKEALIVGDLETLHMLSVRRR